MRDRGDAKEPDAEADKQANGSAYMDEQHHTIESHGRFLAYLEISNGVRTTMLQV